MPFKFHRGGLRLKVLAGFFIPLAIICTLLIILSSVALRQSPLYRLILVLLGAALAAPPVIGMLALKRVVRPLAELSQAAQQVAQGKYGLTVQLDTGQAAEGHHPGEDEIIDLANQFNHMSLQLEKAHADLQQAAAARACELEVLQTVANVVSRSLDLDEILDAVLGEILPRLDMDGGAIALFEGAEGALRLRATHGFSPSVSQGLARLDLEQGIAGLAVRQGQPLALGMPAYRAQAPGPLADLMLEAGVQLLSGTPLLHQGQALGALVLVSKQARNLQSGEIDLLCSVGQQVGIAVQIARLYDQARQELARRQEAEEALRCANEKSERQNRELTLLNRVMTTTASDMPPAAVLEVLCCELVQAFNVTQGAAALLNPDGEALTVVAECLPPGGASAMNVVIPVQGNPATLYVLKNKVPLAMFDAQHDILLAPIQDIMQRRGVASLLILPILVRGQAVGTIGLDANAPREFGDEELALAMRVTAAAAGALERSQPISS